MNNFIIILKLDLYLLEKAIQIKKLTEIIENNIKELKEEIFKEKKTSLLNLLIKSIKSLLKFFENKEIKEKPNFNFLANSVYQIYILNKEKSLLKHEEFLKLVSLFIKLDTQFSSAHTTFEDKMTDSFIFYINNKNTEIFFNDNIRSLLINLKDSKNSKNDFKLLELISKHIVTNMRNLPYKENQLDLTKIVEKYIIQLGKEKERLFYLQPISSIINYSKKMQCHFIQESKKANNNFDLIFTILLLKDLNKEFKRTMFLLFVEKVELTSMNLKAVIELVDHNLNILTSCSSSLFEKIIEHIFITFLALGKEELEKDKDITDLFASLLNSLFQNEKTKNLIFNSTSSFVNCFKLMGIAENNELTAFTEKLIESFSNDISKFSEKICSILLENISNAIKQQKYFLTYNNLRMLKTVLESLEIENEGFFEQITTTLADFLLATSEKELQGLILNKFTLIIKNITCFSILQILVVKINKSLQNMQLFDLEDFLRYKAIEFHQISGFASSTTDIYLSFVNNRYSIGMDIMTADFERITHMLIGNLKRQTPEY